MRAFQDGPLRARLPEAITFASGRCPLGHVLVACGGKGIVAIMIRGSASALLRDLRSEFPQARLVATHDEALVGKVLRYIASPAGPFMLPLDLRGTPFQQAVWRAVQKIPLGDTSTYSQIAQAIGAPKAIRAVASSCTNCRFAFVVPCHRVVSKGSPRDAGARRRNRWLEYERAKMRHG